MNVCQSSKLSPPGKDCILLILALTCSRQIGIYIALNNEEMEGRREGRMEEGTVGGRIDRYIIYST